MDTLSGNMNFGDSLAGIVGFGTDPYDPSKNVGKNPYQKQYEALLAQLQARANGTNSLAAQQYTDMAGQATNNMLGAGRGRSAGAARQSMMQGGAIQQGLANGASQARLAEMNAAQQQQMGLMGQMSDDDYRRQAANLQAYLTNKAMPSGMDKLMQFGASLGPATAMFRGKPQPQGNNVSYSDDYVNPNYPSY
jgi:hypothetical protein